MFKIVLMMIIALHLHASSANIIKSPNDSKNCNYYILKDNIYYSIVEWLSEDQANKNNTYIGDYYRKGISTIYDITSHEEISVWVEEYSKSKSFIEEEYKSICK